MPSQQENLPAQLCHAEVSNCDIRNGCLTYYVYIYMKNTHTHIYIYYCNIYIYLSIYLSNYLFIYLSIYIYMTCQICRAFTRWSSSNLLIRAAALRSRFFSCQSQMARLSEGDLAPPYSMYGIKITQHSFESMQFSSISPGWLYGVNRLGKRCLSAHQWFSFLFWPLLGFQRSWCFFPTFHLRLSSYFPPQDLAASANGASALYTDT